MAPRSMGLIDEVRGALRRVVEQRTPPDLRLGHGRYDRAVPELQHVDALGDLP
jgi:hypothetical protein